MIRLPDWEARLNAFLADRADVVFGYDHAQDPEHFDCCAFGAGAVTALTGVDPMPEFRGRYFTRIGAARALRRYGAGTIDATLDAKFPTRAPAFARRGDLILLAGELGGLLGVCVGAAAVFVGEEGGAPGLVRFSRADWIRCWGIG
jgi:hypothetical protein